MFAKFTTIKCLATKPAVKHVIITTIPSCSPSIWTVPSVSCFRLLSPAFYGLFIEAKISIIDPSKQTVLFFNYVCFIIKLDVFEHLSFLAHYQNNSVNNTNVQNFRISTFRHDTIELGCDLCLWLLWKSFWTSGTIFWNNTLASATVMNAFPMQSSVPSTTIAYCTDVDLTLSVTLCTAFCTELQCYCDGEGSSGERKWYVCDPLSLAHPVVWFRRHLIFT